MIEPLSKIIDVFFNGRPADAPKRRSGVNIESLIKKGRSHIAFRGKVYRVTVEDVTDRLKADSDRANTARKESHA